MRQPQDPRFKRYLKMAYGVFWGGALSTFLLIFLMDQFYSISTSRVVSTIVMGLILSAIPGTLLLIASTRYLKLSNNSDLNLILCFFIFIIQIAGNYFLFLVVWLFHLIVVLNRGLCFHSPEFKSIVFQFV